MIFEPLSLSLFLVDSSFFLLSVEEELLVPVETFLSVKTVPFASIVPATAAVAKPAAVAAVLSLFFALSSTSTIAVLVELFSSFNSSSSVLRISLVIATEITNIINSSANRVNMFLRGVFFGLSKSSILMSCKFLSAMVISVFLNKV